MTDGDPADEPLAPPGRRGPRDLWDPGAQPERTYQAWTRTALAFSATSLLATRLAGDAAAAALATGAIGGLAAMAIVGVQKKRLHSAVIMPAPWPVLALTGSTVLLALVSGVLVLLGWSR